MPIPIAALAIPAATAGLNALLGGNDQTEEQKRYWQYLWNELQKPDSALGYSQQEKADMAAVLRQKIDEASQQGIAGNTASLARRNMISPGQISGMTTDVMAHAGQDYSKGLTDINIASMEAGRQRKSQIISQLPYGANQPRGDSGFLDTLGSLGQNLSYYMNRPKEDSQFNFQMPQAPSTAPNIGGVPSPGDYGPRQQQLKWRMNQQTGQWEQYYG